MNTKIKTILAVITFLGMIVVNALANILPINNTTTGDVSNAYPNLFAPAALTFSIWGVIYALLGSLHDLSDRDISKEDPEFDK